MIYLLGVFFKRTIKDASHWIKIAYKDCHYKNFHASSYPAESEVSPILGFAYLGMNRKSSFLFLINV